MQYDNSNMAANQQSGMVTLPASSRMVGCGGNGQACGTTKGNNTDVNTFPAINNLTMPCGFANCGIPDQQYLDQGRRISNMYDDTAGQAPMPITDGYKFYNQNSYVPHMAGGANGNYAPRRWMMNDAYSGQYHAMNDKHPADFEAAYRQIGNPSRRYPLDTLPIQDRRLAAMGPLSKGAKIGIIVGASVLSLAIITGISVMVMRNKKAQKAFDNLPAVDPFSTL